jgi:hypothetical protein
VRSPSYATDPQPPPRPSGGPHVADLVIDDLVRIFPVAGPSTLVVEDLIRRKEQGLRKYGMALQPGNGRDAVVDAYQETVDQAQYLRQALAEGREVFGLYRRSLEMAVRLRQLIEE